MATINRKGERRKKLQLGNVYYEITVAPVGKDGLCRAEWFCSECNENGTLSLLGSDAAELLREAAIGVRVHHSLYHKSEWQPRKPR